MTKKSSFNPASYRDCHFAMESALTRPGLQYVCETKGQAINFKLRCNRYRKQLRDNDQARHDFIPGYMGESQFDVLTIRQVNEAGNYDAAGTIIRFDQTPAGKGKLIDPETGEELSLPKFSVTKEDLE